MRRTTPYWWSKIPLVRLLICLITGIMLQLQFQFPVKILIIFFAAGFGGLVMYFFLPVKTKFRFSFTSGIFLGSLLASGSALLNVHHDIRNKSNWFGHEYKDSSCVVVQLLEPLVPKPNSYKSLGQVESLINTNGHRAARGRIILYFKKDSSINALGYGSRILVHKNLQAIRNSGNPGSFDYRRYCLYQGITHQVFLQAGEFIILKQENKNPFTSFIFKCRSWTIRVIKKFIPGEKEQGLAEALLIGFKDDLDKTMVQSYSNTGVVHVIAISGLHLGLIYAILVLITKPLSKIKSLVWLRLLIIIATLWLFSIIAGAQPSVLRSAVMFTCMAWGEVLSKRGSIYNTLALSAFMLLCYNPYWIMDAGFQLSYAAVLSIILYYRKVYNWFYFHSRIADMFWKLNAVTISAQLLTLPVSIYHFHQFPTVFLVSNMIAVPLSSVVLIGEICLCLFSFIEPVAQLTGKILHWLIWLMNNFIEWMDGFSFSVWKDLFINMLQAILFCVFILLISAWLSTKRKSVLLTALTCLVIFISIRSWSFIQAYRQQKIIIYNIPKQSAMDIVDGNRSIFFGDSSLFNEVPISNFHLKPSRVQNRISRLSWNPYQSKMFRFGETKILLLDSALTFKHPSPFQASDGRRTVIDLLVLSKNPKLYISALALRFQINQIVIDGSVPAWKARLWKKDCDSLRIPCHDVKEKGAFVLNL